MGERENLDCDAATIKISADLRRDAEARPDASGAARRLNFHNPTSTSHWIQAAPRRKHGHEQGSTPQWREIFKRTES